jgi:hypothetical protein
MLWTQQLNQSGDHRLLLSGPQGDIEAILSVPEKRLSQDVAFLGHPNSLQGGSFNNKVVTTAARACKELGICSLRINFRGVGQSDGDYDNGIGESCDLLYLVNQWQKEHADQAAILIGFSFGSYVTYRVAAQCKHALLLSIAPAVDRYDYQAFSSQPHPWEIIMGDADEVVPFSEVETFAQNLSLPLHRFPKAGHFFHARLIELRETIINIIKSHAQK